MSRQSTPNPSQMRDQDMTDDYFSGRNPYDEVGPYDADYGLSASSRPAPIPYDDPYSDAFNGASTSTSTSTEPFKFQGSGNADRRSSSGFSEQSNRRGRGRGGDRGRRRGGRGNWRESSESRSISIPPQPYDPSVPVPVPSASPTSATANPTLPFFHHQAPMPQMTPWAYPSQNFAGMGMGIGGMQSQHMQQPGFIQPHINPRFASQFGMGMGSGMGMGGYPNAFTQNGHAQQQQQLHDPQQVPQWNSSNEWTVHDGTRNQNQSSGPGTS